MLVCSFYSVSKTPFLRLAINSFPHLLCHILFLEVLRDSLFYFPLIFIAKGVQYYWTSLHNWFGHMPQIPLYPNITVLIFKKNAALCVHPLTQELFNMFFIILYIKMFCYFLHFYCFLSLIFIRKNISFIVLSCKALRFSIMMSFK